MTRSILALSGADRHDFLQGLITNDVAHTKDGLVYAALLTPQGKYLADFFVFERGEALMIDVATSLAPMLAQRLTMYRLRADVQIAQADVIVSRGTGAAPEGALPDPRNQALGWRAYGAADLSDNTDWDALAVEHMIPESGIELTPDSYILEMGFERLSGVDFKKGCYVGQEITARMKHKTQLKKGLAQVQIEGAAQPDTPITTEDGKPAGHLHRIHGTSGLAYLRFDRANAPMQANGATITI